MHHVRRRDRFSHARAETAVFPFLGCFLFLSFFVYSFPLPHCIISPSVGRQRSQHVAGTSSAASATPIKATPSTEPERTPANTPAHATGAPCRIVAQSSRLRRQGTHGDSLSSKSDPAVKPDQHKRGGELYCLKNDK